MPENSIRQFVVVPDVFQRWIGFHILVRTREIMYPLVVVSRSANGHQPVIALGNLQQLVGRIDATPERVHRPRQNRKRYHCADESQHQRAGLPHVESEYSEKTQTEPHQRRRPQPAQRQHQQHARQTPKKVQAVGPELWPPLHQAAAELANGNKNEHRQKKNHRKEKVNRHRLRQVVSRRNAHIELLAKRQHAQALQRFRRHAVAQANQQTDCHPSRGMVNARGMRLRSAKA